MKVTNQLIGAGGGEPDAPPAPYVPVESPNTLESKAVYRIVDILCEGEIEGLADGNKSIYLDNTPLQADDDSYNFEGVTIETRYGLPDQTTFSGFPDGSTTPVSVGVELTQAGGTVTRQFTDTTADAVYVLVTVPALYEQKDNGDWVGGSIEFTIQINSETAVTKTITGKCTSPYQANYRIELPTDVDTFDVKLTRVTADSATAKLVNKLYWASYTKIIDQKISYMDTAAIAAEVDSSLFGSSVPKRSYRIKGKKVAIPTGYTPPYKDALGVWQAAVYPVTWDGTMQSPAYTSNPAWCFYDLATNERYGAGLEDTGGLLKYDLYQISKYCDELIDDGTDSGVYIPRFTLNFVANNPQDALVLLTTIASSFRGMVSWGAGSVSVSQDAPTDLATGESDPHILVTPSDVLNGLFTYEGSALKARHTVVYVTWNDPDNHYLPTIEVVENKDAIALYGYRPIEIAPPGCDHRMRAHLHGKYLLDTEENETEIVKYTAGLNHAFIIPGMLVAISDPFYANSTRFGGRVSSTSFDGLTITLDSSVTLSIGETYELICALPGDTELLLIDETGNYIITTEDGLPLQMDDPDYDAFYTADGTPTIETKSVTTTPDDAEHTSLTIASKFSINPVKGTIWILSASNLEPRLFSVLSNVESDGKYEITAVFRDPTKYARIESNVLLVAPNYFLYDSTGPILPPSNALLQFKTYYSDGFLKNMLIFSWEHPGDERIKEFRVQWKLDDDNWQDFLTTRTFSVEKREVQVGTYYFRVQSVSTTGATSAYAEDDLAVATDTMPDVTGLVLVDGATSTEFNGGDAKFAWDQVATSDVPIVGGTDPWFTSYKVEILKSAAVVRTEYPVTPEYVYSYEKNVADSGPDRTFTIRVYQLGNLGQLSSNAATLEVSNPAPTMAGFTPTITAGFKAVSIDWSAWSTTDTDFDSFRVYLDTNADPTTLVQTVGPESEGWYVSELVVGTNYKIKIVPVDKFGAGTASEIANGTPIILAAADVDIELTSSITMSDSDSNSEATLSKLYDRNTASDGVSYTLSGTDKYIQYAFGIETYIDKVIIHAADANADIYLAYSQDGSTWSYLKAEADHTLTANGELEAATNQADAQTNYWSLDTGLNVATFPARVVAKYCKLFFIGTYTTELYELVFVREVIAEQVIADNLSAISANLGTVSAGIIQSSNYVANTSGMQINATTGTAEFNDISLIINGVADTTLISGGFIGTDLVVASSINVTNLAAVSIDTGDLDIDGSLSVSATGSIYSDGKTSYTDDTAGFWLGYDASDSKYKFYFGDSSEYIKWDGTQLLIKKPLTTTTYTSNDTWVVPDHVDRIYVTAVGGGGGGGGGSLQAGGNGAGSGEYVSSSILPVTPGETVTIVVGTGGAGGAGAPQSSGSYTDAASLGTAGSSSSVTSPSGGNVTVSGGSPAGFSTLPTGGGAAGAVNGTAGSAGSNVGAYTGGAGGTSPSTNYAAGGGGGSASQLGNGAAGANGPSFAGNGTGSSAAANTGAGGGGGSGPYNISSYKAGDGGAGGSGKVIIRY